VVLSDTVYWELAEPKYRADVEVGMPLAFQLLAVFHRLVVPDQVFVVCANAPGVDPARRRTATNAIRTLLAKVFGLPEAGES